MLKQLLKKLKAFHVKMFPIPMSLVIAAFISCESQKKEAWEVAPLVDGQSEVVSLEEKSGLKVERIRFQSLELSEPRFYLALLPNTHELPDRVLLVNHGWFDRPEYLLKYLHIDQVYARLLAEGSIKPAIVVLPDVRFDDRFRRNASSFPFAQYLTLIAEEVCRNVSQQYHVRFVRENWGITGFSFGGYLSLDVGRRYPGRFGSIGAVSSFYDKEWLFWPSTVPVDQKADSKGRGKQTIIESGQIPRVFLACGTNDRFFNTMSKLHLKFLELGIPHTWSIAPGGHTWEYWSSVLEELLKFHLGD